MSVKVRQLPAGSKSLELFDEPWRDEFADLFVSAGCDSLGVGSLSGTFVYDDIDFVTKLPGLELIGTFGEVRDCSAVGHVEGLRALHVNGGYNGMLPFGELTGLRVLSIPFPRSAEGLAGLVELRRLFITSWPKEYDLDVLGEYPHLEWLRVEFRRTAQFSTGGLRGMPNLRELLLYDGEIADPSGLTALTKLLQLELRGTKVSNLDFLPAMPGLSRLVLENSGTIDSVAPLREMKALVSVALSGKTSIRDGDLLPLLQLPPSTTFVALEKGAPHYSHKPAQVRRS